MRYARAGPIHRRPQALGQRRQQAHRRARAQARASRPPASSSPCSAPRSRSPHPRAGAAVGIAISLGTTILFLLLTQIMKAVGAGGVVDPVAAAWLPNSGVSGGGAGAAPADEDVEGRSRSTPRPPFAALYISRHDFPPPRHRRHGHRRPVDRLAARVRGTGHRCRSPRKPWPTAPAPGPKAVSRWRSAPATAPASTRPTPSRRATGWPIPKPSASSQARARTGFTSCSRWGRGSTAAPTGGCGSGSRRPTPGPGSSTPAATAPARR